MQCATEVEEGWMTMHLVVLRELGTQPVIASVAYLAAVVWHWDCDLESKEL